MSKEYEILEETPAYRGFFNLTRYRLRHTLYGGGWTQPITRELFHRGQCVAVLPYDPVTDRLVLIEQFRIGAVGTQQPPWLIETVAGAVEAGETAEEVARRESLEEAGCELGQLIRIGEFFTSPGGTSEKVTLFCGIVAGDLQEGLFGLHEEHEDIRAIVLGFDEAWAWLSSGVIDSVVPALALQWLMLNKEQIQNERD